MEKFEFKKIGRDGTEQSISISFEKTTINTSCLVDKQEAKKLIEITEFLNKIFSKSGDLFEKEEE